jgi:hypothetical protein
MGDVHAANPGQQELAAHRRHGVEHLHRHPAPGQCLGGHQAGGAATDHGDKGRRRGEDRSWSAAGCGKERAFYPSQASASTVQK